MDIIQPDITAPGVDILAAWTAKDGPTRMTFNDKRVVKYNIFSGTSMACPHVSAAAVLLKAMYPTWSPAAIRSAIMTSGNFKINILPTIPDCTNSDSSQSKNSAFTRPNCTNNH